MKKPKNGKQLEFEDFYHPFGEKLSSDNRWVELSKLIPWNEIEKIYHKSLSDSDVGAKPLASRLAFGALLIKEHLRASDRETVEQIRENPFLQYFLGFKEYCPDPPFDASMFVHFRSRFGDTLEKINEFLVLKAIKATQDDGDDNQANKKPKRKSESESPVSDTPPKETIISQERKNKKTSAKTLAKNKGKLIVDATCTPADITFPTDLKLLNEAREKSEKIIDVLFAPLQGKETKPRTYRKNARKDFLSTIKAKTLSKSKRRKMLRKQLGYLKRNLKSIEQLSRKTSLTELSRVQYKSLLVITEVYRQQQWMFDHRVNRIDDRIVSISQPHVRPIKRGKAGAATEFGAKISLSVIEGFSIVDHISWDAFNEGGDLIDQIEAYFARFGHYPESVHADKIYRTRENRRYCKEKGIRLSGPPLGRQKKVTETNRLEIEKASQQAYADELDRIPVEGKFGQAKRRYGLNRIMCKLPITSKAAIMMSFILMNLKKWLIAIFYILFLVVRRTKLIILAQTASLKALS